jgi:hypothetical protein
LEVTQLQSDGVPANHVGRIGEALGGFEFAFSPKPALLYEFLMGPKGL